MAESPEDRLRRRLIRKYQNEALVDRLLETPDGRQAVLKARSRSAVVRRGTPTRQRRGTAPRTETPHGSPTAISPALPPVVNAPMASPVVTSERAPRRAQQRIGLSGRGKSMNVDDVRQVVKKRALPDLGYISLGHRGAHAAKGKKRDKTISAVPPGDTGTPGDAPVQGLDPHRGLPPGWYRDPADGTRARYWNGVTLGDDSRPIAVNGSRASVEAYQGLAVGWYRDEDNPRLARYWDGMTLSDERGLVAE